MNHDTKLLLYCAAARRLGPEGSIRARANMNRNRNPNASMFKLASFFTIYGAGPMKFKDALEGTR